MKKIGKRLPFSDTTPPNALAEFIKRQLERMDQDDLETKWLIGQAQIIAKAQLGHNGFTQWQADHFPESAHCRRTLNNYKRLAAKVCLEELQERQAKGMGLYAICLEYGILKPRKAKQKASTSKDETTNHEKGGKSAAWVLECMLHLTEAIEHACFHRNEAKWTEKETAAILDQIADLRANLDAFEKSVELVDVAGVPVA